MNKNAQNESPSRSWIELYQAVILEPDLTKLPECIVEAEFALEARARDLLYATSDRSREEESLRSAIGILRALRRSLKPHPGPKESDLDHRKTA